MFLVDELPTSRYVCCVQEEHMWSTTPRQTPAGLLSTIDHEADKRTRDPHRRINIF